MKKITTRDLQTTINTLSAGLRGVIEGWDFKPFFLSLLLYKYFSEETMRRAKNLPDFRDQDDYDYSKAPEDDSIYISYNNPFGFVIKPSQLFCNVINQEKLTYKLNSIFYGIEELSRTRDMYKSFTGLFLLNFSSSDLGETEKIRDDRIRKMMKVIDAIDFKFSDDTDGDFLGAVYENLATLFMLGSIKSGGEFFTPHGVSDLLVKLALNGRKRVTAIYDPTCGSGSLLIKAAKMLGDGNYASLFGQEINKATYNLCRANLFLNGFAYADFDIAHGDTLERPNDYQRKYKYDTIVANPPFSVSWESSDNPEHNADPRFSGAKALAPKRRADLAFLQHIVEYLQVGGTGAVVMFPGVLYRVGAEQKIREHLVNSNVIDAVIALPEKLFYNTGIPTVIIVVKKNKKDDTVLFLDATKNFTPDVSNNILTDDNVEYILNCVANRHTVPGLSKLATRQEIEDQLYSLACNNYIDTIEEDKTIDIDEIERELTKIEERNAIIKQEIKKLSQEIKKLPQETAEG